MILTVQGDLLVINQADSTEMKQLYRIATGHVQRHIANRVKKRNQSNWDGTICYLYNGLYLPAGLWRRVYDLKNAPIPYAVTINNMMSLFDQTMSVDEFKTFVDKLDTPFDARQDQIEFAVKACQAKKSCYKLGTSYGKTFLCYLISRFLRDSNRLKKADTHDGQHASKSLKTLMIVPSIHLVDQCYNDMEYYQQDTWDAANNKPLNVAPFKVYKIHSSAWNAYRLQDADLVCGTYQSLVNMPADWFEQFDFVITDEAHMAPANSIITVFSHCKNAAYRLGISGSLPGPETVERLTIEAYIGPMLGEFAVATMKEQGIVCDFAIKRMILEHKRGTDDDYFNYLKSLWQFDAAGNAVYSPFDDSSLILNAEQHHCMHNTNANMCIASIFVNLDMNSIVLCKRRDHVQLLAEQMQAIIDAQHLDKEVHIIRGDVQLEERKDILSKMEAEPTRHIVIATVKTLSTGVSVHAIFYAGFCMLGKSSNVALQSVGRLLRKHPLKQKAVIIDISQKLHCTPSIAEDSKGFKWIPDSYRYANYDIRHFGVRKRIYEAERYDVDENVTTFEV